MMSRLLAKEDDPKRLTGRDVGQEKREQEDTMEDWNCPLSRDHDDRHALGADVCGYMMKETVDRNHLRPK